MVTERIQIRVNPDLKKTHTEEEKRSAGSVCGGAGLKKTEGRLPIRKNVLWKKEDQRISGPHAGSAGLGATRPLLSDFSHNSQNIRVRLPGRPQGENLTALRILCLGIHGGVGEGKKKENVYVPSRRPPDGTRKESNCARS